MYWKKGKLEGATHQMGSEGGMVKSNRLLACDACKLRKVKCNGQQGCQQCNHLNLRCLYSGRRPRGSFTTANRAIPDKKRRKRGHVISLCKDVLVPRNENRVADIGIACSSPDHPLEASTQSTMANQYGPSFFMPLIPEYMAFVYPFYPIITEYELRESIFKMTTDIGHCYFVYATGAVILNLKRNDPLAFRHVELLIMHVLELRGAIKPDRSVTIRTIMTSDYVHTCLVAHHNPEMGWFYLREAIAMAQILRIDETRELAKLNASERARRQRLTWMLCIHERFLGIHIYRPATFLPLLCLPEYDPTLTAGVHNGFIQIIRLFRNVDSLFLKHWLNSGADSTITSTWIEETQKRLDVSEIDTEGLTEVQQTDIMITRHWLRMIVWEIAMSACLLSSDAPNDFMSLDFPVCAARDLRELVVRMSPSSFDVNGSCIVQKLFELTYAIADVIIHVPASSFQRASDRYEIFLVLIRFVLGLGWIDELQRHMLQEKLDTLCSAT